MSPNVVDFERVQESTPPLDLARKDLRGTSLWVEISEFYRSLYKPSFDKISNATELAISPDGKIVAFTGSYWPSTPDDRLIGKPLQRICLLPLSSKKLEVVTYGPNDDRSAKWSPSGDQLLFLSDRKKKGVFQPYLLSSVGFSEAELLIAIDGNVEYAAWSPDGHKILLGIAGLGPKDTREGSYSKPKEEDSWLPIVEAGFEDSHWRKLFIFDFKSKKLVKNGSDNPWDAAWAGNDQIIKIVSEGPGEEDWYCSDVMICRAENELHQITIQKATYNNKMRQFGALASAPGGETVAFVRALASDRPFAVGDVYIACTSESSISKSSELTMVNLNDVDVAYLEFWDKTTLFYAGKSGMGCVFGRIILNNENGLPSVIRNEELLRTNKTSSEAWLPCLSAVDESSFVAVLQSRHDPPEIVHVKEKSLISLHSFAHEGTKWQRSVVGESSVISWKSKDGLEIQGLLDLPRDVPKPYPLILHIHGGPCASWQNSWSEWSRIQLLVARGYAVLSPNPRGSTGRGQKFTEKILNDVGGRETQDHLSGIDYLIDQGVVDQDRLGVFGGSHGGFQTSWIVTQDPRFKACVPIAAVTDWHSFYFTTNIRKFTTLFIEDDPYEVGKDSLFLDRSPISMARKTKTPTLQISGDVDLCVDKSQAKEFHNALLDNGVESVLAIYPGEGHGIRNFPAVLDFDVRTVGWFEKWMPSDRKKKTMELVS